MTPHDELPAKNPNADGSLFCKAHNIRLFDPGPDEPYVCAACLLAEKRDLTAKLEAHEAVRDACFAALPECQVWGDVPGHIEELKAKLEAETRRKEYYRAAFGSVCEDHANGDIPASCVFCALEAERNAHAFAIDQLRGIMQKGIDDERRAREEVELVLKAWHNIFETTQLSHAHARLQAAEEGRLRAKSRLAAVFERTRERCKAAVYKAIGGINASLAVRAIDALAPEESAAAQASGESEHVKDSANPAPAADTEMLD